MSFESIFWSVTYVPIGDFKSGSYCCLTRSTNLGPELLLALLEPLERRPEHLLRADLLRGHEVRREARLGVGHPVGRLVLAKLHRHPPGHRHVAPALLSVCFLSDKIPWFLLGHANWDDIKIPGTRSLFVRL